MSFKFIPQHDKMDCGPSCLAMVSNYFGKNYSLQFFRENSFITREGVSLLGISEAANKVGLKTISTKLVITELVDKIDNLPCIIHWNKNHFVVLTKIKTKLISKKKTFQIADPSYGIMNLNENDFKNSWLSDSNNGVALFLFPTDEFYNKTINLESKITLKCILSFLKPFRKQLFIMFALIFLGSLLNLIFPFLTQNLIDKGVNGKNLNVISLILLAQLAVFFWNSNNRNNS